MNVKNILLLLVFGLFSVTTTAQKSKLRKAEKQYNKYNYINAIRIYESIANEDPEFESAEVFQRLGNSYYFKADLKSACKWYDKLFAMGNSQEAEYYYRYAHSLKSEERYEEADKMMETFSVLVKDKRTENFTKKKDYLNEIKSVSGTYEVDILDINSSLSDFAPSYHGNKMIISSSRGEGPRDRNYKWNGQPFLDLYSISRNKVEYGDKSERDTTSGALKLFSEKLNTKYHESTTAFTKDGNTVYFTRNNYNNGRARHDKDKVNRLKMYVAKKEDGEWKSVKEMPFNSDHFSVAHPALSPDERKLYFSSDRPGTTGSSDIYEVLINENGTYGDPRNLGPNINTEGRETFPFMAANGDLYFSSDGRPGLGGLDVFVLTKEGEVKNIGAPVNSPFDDFSLIFDSEADTGFFASNREGGYGDDDIYAFRRIPPCNQQLLGSVADMDTKAPLANSTVTLFNSGNELLETTTSDDSGRFSFKTDLICGEVYLVRASKDTYSTVEKVLPALDDPQVRTADLLLKTEVKPIEVGDDLAELLNIPIIYFDLNKHYIRPDAAAELAKVYAVLVEHPSMEIDIRSHTDSRGSDWYNRKLSDRRAKSTRKHLISKGIAASRLTAAGYGESRLVNGCSNGVKCSEAEHQRNRRSEFIVTKK